MAGRGQSVTGLTDKQLQVFEDLASDYMVELLTQIANRHAAAMLDRAGLTAAADPLIPADQPPPTPPPTPADFAAIPSEVNAAIAQNIIPLVAQAYISGGGVIRSNLIDLGATGLPRVHSVDAEAYLRTAPIGYYDWIGADLLDQVRTGLADGLAAGDSIPELADRVKAAAGITSRQATLTARTSVIAANNSASIDVMAAAQIDGTEKEWLATNDLRTRASHLAADGQRVPLDGKFTLDDGSECEYPGEYTLPPAQRDNCRCTVGYVIPDRVIGPTGGAEARYSGDSLAQSYVQGDITHSQLVDAAENPPTLPGHISAPKAALPNPAGTPAQRAAAQGLKIRPRLARATTVPEIEDVIRFEAKQIADKDLYVEVADGASVLTLREHAEGVLRVLERFPNADLQSFIVHDLADNFYAQAGDGEIEFAMRYASTTGRSKYLQDLQRGVEGWEPGSGRVTSFSFRGSGNPAATAIHEMAHILDLDTIGPRLATRVDALVRDMASEIGISREALVSRMVSEYATTNTTELIAEAFGDTVINGEAASDLSRGIYDLIVDEYESSSGVYMSAEDLRLGGVNAKRAADALAGKTVPQLRTLARERGVTIPTGAKKDDIVKLLRETEPAATPTVEAAAAEALTPAEFEARVAQAKTGAAAEDAPPVRAQVDASAGVETSRWKVTGVAGPDGSISGANGALTRYLRQPTFMNERLRGESARAAAMREQLERHGLAPSADKLAQAAAQADKDVAALDRLMAQSGLRSDAVLWRGADGLDLSIPDDAVGFEWTDKGFVSTAARQGYAQSDFASGESRVLLRILAPEGTPALSLSGGEGEVLLGRDLHFRVVAEHDRLQQVSFSGKKSAGARVLDVEIVPARADALVTATPAAAVDELATMKVPALRSLARERGVTIPTGAKKDDIVKLLREAAAEPVEAVVEENPLVTAARVRQAAIDEARAVADLTAKVFESLGAEVEPAVLRTQIEQTAARLKVPDKVRDALLKAVDTGDAKKIATAADRVAKNAGLTRVGTPETEVPFSHAEHQAVPGAQVRAGEAARIIRPGYMYQYGNEVVQISKAAVEEGLTRAETIANAKRLIERDASTAQLRTAGVKKVGTVSDRPVKYDPTKYELRGGAKAPAGAKVRVVEPGYTTVYRGQVIEVSKPVVEVIPEARSASAAPLKKIMKMDDPEAQAEFAKAIDGEYAGGIRAEVATTQRIADYEELDDGTMVPATVVTGHLYSAGGQKIGDFQRVFYNGDHGFEAHHELLQIRESYQGSGFASDFNANLYDWYRRSGVKRVTVYADIDVGGYTWATQGFDFVSQAARKDLFYFRLEPVVDKIAGRGIYSGKISQRDYHDLTRGAAFAHDEFMAQLPLFDALNARVAAGEEVSAYELSQLGRKPGQGKDDWWIGKVLMMGSHWNGVRLI